MRKIVAKVGDYTNAHGEHKNKWLEVGVILSNQNGEYIMLNPTVDLSGVLMKQRLLAQKNQTKTGDNVMCSIFEQDNQQQAPQQQPRPPAEQDDMDDDIPF